LEFATTSIKVREAFVKVKHRMNAVELSGRDARLFLLGKLDDWKVEGYDAAVFKLY
jgi:hypothetical protein